MDAKERKERLLGTPKRIENPITMTVILSEDQVAFVQEHRAKNKLNSFGAAMRDIIDRFPRSKKSNAA